MNKLLTVVFLILSTAAIAQSTVWTPRNRENPKMLKADSALVLPTVNILYAPYSNKDSLGRMFYYTTDNKIYGQFNAGVKKPLATEDSTLRTFDAVLRAGNTTTRSFQFLDTSNIRWDKFTDYAKIRYTSTGDANGTSNLVFTLGDNNSDNESFYFVKDTGNNQGTVPMLDTLMMLSSNRVESRKNLTTRSFLGIGTTTPMSSLSVKGSVEYTVTTVTGNYSAGSGDYYINVNNATAAVITLPTPFLVIGRTYVIKKISAAGGGTVTITPSFGTIDGAANSIISTQNATRTVYTDGTNWFLL